MLPLDHYFNNKVRPSRNKTKTQTRSKIYICKNCGIKLPIPVQFCSKKCLDLYKLRNKYRSV